MSDQNPVDAVVTGEEATLEGLFPELAEYLSNPEAAPPSRAQTTEPEEPQSTPDADDTSDVPPPYGVTDESLLRHAEHKFSPPAQQPGDDEGETQGPPPESPPAAEEPPPTPTEPTEAPPAEPTGEQPTTIQIGDQSYRVDELTQLLQFRDELERNPQLQQAVIQGLTAQQQPQPQDQPPQPQGAPQLPEDLDPDDPTFKALAPAIQSLYEQNKQLNHVVQTQYNQWMNEQVAQRDAIITRAKTSFAKQHDLTDTQVNELADIAGRYNVVGTYMSGTDPITGQPVRPDPLMAVERALEAAYFSKPEYREAEYRSRIAQLRDDHKRKTKLSAISGNSGSQPRSQPAPRNEAERRQQMIDFVAGSMFGTGQEG